MSRLVALCQGDNVSALAFVGLVSCYSGCFAMFRLLARTGLLPWSRIWALISILFFLGPWIGQWKAEAAADASHAEPSAQARLSRVCRESGQPFAGLQCGVVGERG